MGTFIIFMSGGIFGGFMATFFICLFKIAKMADKELGIDDDNLITYMSDGNAYIEYENLSERGNILLGPFLLGCDMVASSYPDNVTLV